MSRFHEDTVNSKNLRILIKASLKSKQFDEASVNNILYFPCIYLKRTFESESHEFGSINYGPGMKYLKRIFNKSHIKYSMPTLVKHSPIGSNQNLINSYPK